MLFTLVIKSASYLFITWINSKHHFDLRLSRLCKKCVGVNSITEGSKHRMNKIEHNFTTENIASYILDEAMWRKHHIVLDVWVYSCITRRNVIHKTNKRKEWKINVSWTLYFSLVSFILRQTMRHVLNLVLCLAINKLAYWYSVRILLKNC